MGVRAWFRGAGGAPPASTSSVISDLMLDFQQQAYACERERWALSGTLRDLLEQHGYTGHYGREATREDLVAAGLLQEDAE
jgi:hypothetical protein